MKAIQIFSSRPILAGRNAAGMYKKTKEIELPEVVELSMQLSALQWRRTNGSITLYTDLSMKKYLEKKNLLKILGQHQYRCTRKFLCYYSKYKPFYFLVGR